MPSMSRRQRASTRTVMPEILPAGYDIFRPGARHKRPARAPSMSAQRLA
jgi:hypothetical protein